MGRRSSTLPAPEGAYAALPAWSSRRQYLAAVAAAVGSEQGRELRKAWVRKWVADEPFWAIVHALASFADNRTGRGVTASRQTIAVKAGLLDDVDVDVSTDAGRRRVQAAMKRVQQVTAILTELGLYAMVRVGRPLSAREQAMFRARGLYQKAVGNEAALTVPGRLASAAAARRPADDGVTFHLHPKTSTKSSSPVTEIPNKPRSRRTAAARPGQQGDPTRPKSTRAPMRPLSERAPAFRQLVAALDAATVRPDGSVVGRFTQGRSVLGLVRILDDFGIDASYTVDELLQRVLRWEPDYRFRDGLGWLRARLARAFRRPTSNTSVPPTPPEFSGQRDLEELWAADATFRDGWVRLQALHAAEDAASTPPIGTATPAPGDVDAAAASPAVTQSRRVSAVPEWRRELEAAQARVDAADEDELAAAITAARAAGGPSSRRRRLPYVPAGITVAS